jgi:hypothetical protein
LTAAVSRAKQPSVGKTVVDPRRPAARPPPPGRPPPAACGATNGTEENTLGALAPETAEKESTGQPKVVKHIFN